MQVTDEMVEAACDAYRDAAGGWEHAARHRMKAALEAALASAPPCEYIRGTSEGTHYCALAAAPQGTPVAWRWKAVLDDGRISNWVLTHSEPPAYAVAREPLYTAPQPAPDDRLREAARMALEALDEATAYTGSESWSPSMTRDCERSRDALREALEK